MANTREVIELFHLLFLRQLGNKLDKKFYALKGGCNLRFYFKSIRYSEDIDFDATTISLNTLENKISKLLESIDFKKILQSKKIEIIQINPAKQTKTTQRWKLLLRHEDSTIPLPTKIEFSRREMDPGVIYEAVDSDVITHHQLYPVLCNHYDLKTAFKQKVNALIHRTQTQARDIFDLKWLLDHAGTFKMTGFSQHEIQTAIEHIHHIRYAEFKSQVVAFLMDEYKTFYDSKEQWRMIQEQVITALTGTEHATDRS